MTKQRKGDRAKLKLSAKHKASLNSSDAISSDTADAILRGLQREQAEQMAEDRVVLGATVAAPARSGYRLESVLASGGQGTVFKATELGVLERTVAVKVLHASSGRQKRKPVKASLKTEVAAFKRVSDIRLRPATEKFDDGCEQLGSEGPWIAYLAMKFVPGRDLREASLNASANHRLDLLIQICESVARFHDNDVWHSDLKPENIIVSTGGVPCVIDYGLCRKRDRFTDLPPEDRGWGTKGYRAPELEEGGEGPLGPLCDVYSLGVLVKEIMWRSPTANTSLAIHGIREPQRKRLADAVADTQLEAKDRAPLADLLRTLREVQREAADLSNEALATFVSQYLTTLIAGCTKLSPLFPDRLRSQPDAFDCMRQRVRVVAERDRLAHFETYRADEAERLRGAGMDVQESVVYGHRHDELGPREEHAEGERSAEPPKPIDWEQAAEAHRHAVIVGDPGFGKSWLVCHDAARVARHELEVMGTGPNAAPHSICLPVLLTCNRMADGLGTGKSPFEVLVDLTTLSIKAAANDKPPTEDQERQLRHYLEERLCDPLKPPIIFLDALDEVDTTAAMGRQSRRQKVREIVTGLQSDDRSIRVTSRLAGYEPLASTSNTNVFHELELLPFEPEDAEKFVIAWFEEHDDADRADALLRRVRDVSALSNLARIPLMLTIVCDMAEDRPPEDLPSRRVEFYAGCIERLLIKWPLFNKNAQEGTYQAHPNWKEAVLDLARHVAFVLFETGADACDHKTLSEAVREWCNCEAGRRCLPDLGQANAAGAEGVLLGTGLLTSHGTGDSKRFFFLHRTFHEYLAAEYLAECAKGNGFDGVHVFVDKKAWDPRWEQIIVLLAGLLDDPRPLLEMLAGASPTDSNPKGDDILHHRLRLAGLACGELGRDAATIATATIERIDKLIWDVCRWLDYRCQLEPNVLTGLQGVLIAQAAIDPPGSFTLGELASLLGEEDLSTRDAAMDAIRIIGAAAAHDSAFLANLASLLGDEDLSIKHAAVGAIRGIGAAAAKDEKILRGLASLLGDEDLMTKRAAADAIGCIGAEAARDENVLKGLASLLVDEDSSTQVDAVNAIRCIGATAARGGVFLAQLASLLRHENLWAKRAVVSAIEGIGAAAAQDGDFLAQLASLLGDEDPETKCAAARAIGGIGEAAVQDANVLKGLASLLGDKDLRSNDVAADAIGGIGAAAARNGAFLSQLASLLANGNSWTKRAVVNAIGGIGVAAARDGAFLSQLASLLGNEDPETKCAAANAIGCIGAEAVQDANILKGLASLLADKDSSTRDAAVNAIGGIGASAAQDGDFLAQIASLLGDEDSSAKRAAANAIRYIGAEAARDENILKGLASLLEDEDPKTNRAAANAIGCIGAEAARDENVLKGLASLLVDEEFSTKCAAARAIGCMGAAAVRDENVLEGLESVLVDENSFLTHVAGVTIRDVGAVAARDGAFLAKLALLLEEKDPMTKCAAANAIGCIGAEAVQDANILKGLASLLVDEDSSIKRAAALAIGGIGTAAAQDANILEGLAALLVDEDSSTRDAALNAIGGIGAAVAQNGAFLAQLASLLKDEDPKTNRAAANAIGDIGAEAARDENILKSLASLLREKDPMTKCAAANAIGCIGAEAAQDANILEGLASLLVDEDSSTKRAAALAIGGIGTTAAQDANILEGLASLLMDEDFSTKHAAAQTIGGIGAAAALDGVFVTQLASVLKNADRASRNRSILSLEVRGFSAGIWLVNLIPSLAARSARLFWTNGDLHAESVQSLSAAPPFRCMRP